MFFFFFFFKQEGMILWKGTVKEDRGEETKVAAVEGFFFFLLAFEVDFFFFIDLLYLFVYL